MGEKMRGMEMGIDLGTANTVIINSKGKILLNEPSVIAFETKNGKRKVHSVGAAAKAMIGKSPGYIEVISPLSDGVIANFEAAEHMIFNFFKSATPAFQFVKPRVIACIPHGATSVEKRAIKDCIVRSGARKVGLLSEPLAAALGANLSIFEPKASMVVDIGGGTTEIALISLGSIVHAMSLKVGGTDFDFMVANVLKKNLEFNIGIVSAEKIKKSVITVSSHITKVNSITDSVSGLSVYDGLPKKLTIDSFLFKDAGALLVEKIELGIRMVLDKTPPDLASDVHREGIFLTGGGAFLRDLDAELRRRLGIQFHIANEPMLCVANGIALAFSTPKKLVLDIEY
jgi:rod shape-determining protein MreB